jgi:hypothetical protein
MLIITKKIKEYQQQIQKKIENGSMFPDLKGHKYNPQEKQARLIRDQIRTKLGSQTAFKKRSKRKSKKVSEKRCAKRSKKKSKGNSRRVSAKRSKKKSKGNSRRVSLKRSK